MKVLIPTPLRSYTGARLVVARGNTLAEVLADLEARYPGIRFRMIDEQGYIRPHLRFFVNGRAERDLAVTLVDADEVAIVQALSGG
jgi:molybdopterin converting factor small subunit